MVLGACANSEAPNANHPPEIISIESHFQSVAVTGTTTLTCRARDVDGDALSYRWSASGGTITGGAGERVTWTAPEQPGTFIIRVTVADDHAASTKASKTLTVHRNSPLKVLVHVYCYLGGNCWWFPQTGPFSEMEFHNGKALADRVRNLGFKVYEMSPPGFGTRNVDSLLNQYDRVIAIDCTAPSEFDAYDGFLKRRGTALIMVADFNPFCDFPWPLAAKCGIVASGTTWPNTVSVTTFANHEITAGVAPFAYPAGAAFLDPDGNPDLEILGWLPDTTFIDCDEDKIRDPSEISGPLPVMGILHHPNAKVFFIGDAYMTMGYLPQPFVDNLIHWAFGQ